MARSGSISLDFLPGALFVWSSVAGVHRVAPARPGSVGPSHAPKRNIHAMQASARYRGFGTLEIAKLNTEDQSKRLFEAGSVKRQSRSTAGFFTHFLGGILSLADV